MVRKYQRKTNKASYSKEDLALAVENVLSGKYGTLRASKIYKIPRGTIKDHVKGRRGVKSTTLGRPTAIPIEAEKSLADAIKCMEKWGFGVSRKEILAIVGEYVTQNNIPNPFKNNHPGEDWFLQFKKRHNLSIKKAECLEYARKKNTDPFIIDQYFKLLKTTLVELGLENSPSNIWNMDETSFCNDPTKTKVVGERGVPCTRITSGPGKNNTTVLFAAAADGQKAPPLIIFKGKNVWNTWMANEGKGYPNTAYAASENGWMETVIFRNYFKKTFIPSLGDRRPVLVIYDGHATHLGIELIEEAIKNNIAIIKLPPHCSHLLQPLDLAVFKSIKVSWDEALVKWQRKHLGKHLPKDIFSEMIGSLWEKLNPKIIIEGFKKGGIHPYNPHVISDEKYDINQLKRWKASQKRESINHVTGEDEGSSTLVGETNNDVAEENEDHSMQSQDKTEETGANVMTPVTTNLNQDDANNNFNCNKSFISFEELLLNTCKSAKTDKETKTRKRLAPGAELITSEDVRQRQRDLENIKSQKKCTPKKVKAKIRKISKKREKKHKNDESSSDSGEDQDITLEDESDYENLDEAVATEELELGEDHQTFKHVNEFKVEDWVLTKLNTEKNTAKYYVGQIQEKDLISENITVKFLRRIKSKDLSAINPSFSWPDIDDIAEIPTESLVRILPKPSVGRRGEIKFSFNFSGYNVN